ncbi:MAG: S9 family peptidase [Dokdonella sp.]|nr:S9 family peptidase [Dokdonella sp.]MCB1574213.1 S9 family peptidase [Xanthomonadales bacterium]MCB1577422.1 S9 family peptidase [Xanthomonadales bacterium]
MDVRSSTLPGAPWVSIAIAGILALVPLLGRAEPDIDRFLKRDTIGEVKISPGGTYFAATVALEDRTVLVISRRADHKLTAKSGGGEHSDIADFWWVNDERVVIAIAERTSALERPVATGELFAMNADGSGAKQLFAAVDSDDQGVLVSLRGDHYRHAELIDTLPRDHDHILVAITTYTITPVTRVARMDVRNGRTTPVANAPLRRARFVMDAQGQVRFAEGSDKENFSQLLYRVDDGSDWQPLNVERTSGHVEWAIGFSADGKTAYLQVEQASGPDLIQAMDVASGKRQTVLADPSVDPESIYYSAEGNVPVGAYYMSDRRRARFFDESSRDAIRQRTLEAAFPGQNVVLISRTADSQLTVVRVSSDRNPGDFYLYNERTHAADGIFSRRLWLKPEDMAGSQAIELKARDGLTLHGYLTLPRNGKSALPLVIYVHGGPIGVYDDPEFDGEVQLLASAGYAVLRINFRGSGNYGRQFLHAGEREWGKRMQDDLTDATHWAIEQKIADPQRICIYGASYGAYAAMMGLVREPDLYRCGVGYVGVYDLPMMVRDGSARDASAKIWYEDWVGKADSLEAISPSYLAAQIRRPVFLAAGGKDDRAPLAHSKRMEKALIKAGVETETLYFPTEGHGFYTDEHRHEFYEKLLAFLDRHIGKDAQQPVAADTPANGG